MKIRFGIAMLCLLSMVANAIGQSSTQFDVAQVLQSELIEGPGYRIDPVVKIQDHRYLFVIHTKYGDVSALGLPMLELRLREHYAIENGLKLSKKFIAVGNAVDTAKSLPAGIKTVLSDPLGSIARVPLGVNETVKSALHPLDRRAGSQMRRDLAFQIGADPETRNPVLSRSLSLMALRGNVGVMGTGAAFSSVVPGLGLLSSANDTKDMLRNKPPREIMSDLNRELQVIGVSKELSTALAEDRVFTTSEKLIFASHVKSLRGIENLDSLVRRAVATDSEAKWLSEIEQVMLLTKLHRQKTVRRVVPADVLTVEMMDGSFTKIVAVDYLDDIGLVNNRIAEFRKSRPDTPVSFYISGIVADDVRKTIQLANVRLVETGRPMLR